MDKDPYWWLDTIRCAECGEPCETTMTGDGICLPCRIKSNLKKAESISKRAMIGSYVAITIVIVAFVIRWFS